MQQGANSEASAEIVVHCTQDWIINVFQQTYQQVKGVSFKRYISAFGYSISIIYCPKKSPSLSL